MNELDLLKTHWQKGQDYIKFKKEDIIQMIHKSSSSIVKWLLMICCAELLLGLSLYFIFPHDKEESSWITILEWTFDIIIYGIILYFIYNFFKLYKNIKSSSSTKSLLENIIKVRENAHRYIQFNLLYMSIILIVAFVFTIIEKSNERNS